MKTWLKIAALGVAAGAGLLILSSDARASDGGDMASDFDDLLKAAAAKYGISDWLILKAIMGNESSYGTNPRVIAGIQNPDDAEASKSSDGKSWGVMQLTFDTANWLRPGTSVRDLNTPSISIDLSAKYVAYLLKREDGDLQNAIEAYNEGPGNVDKGIPDDDYWNKFQRHYSELKNQA